MQLATYYFKSLIYFFVEFLASFCGVDLAFEGDRGNGVVERVDNLVVDQAGLAKGSLETHQVYTRTGMYETSTPQQHLEILKECFVKLSMNFNERVEKLVR